MAGLSGRFAFIPRSIEGDMVGASANQPTGTNGYLYYDVMDGMPVPAPVTNIYANLNNYQGGAGGGGKRIGVIAYDYVSAFWSCIFATGSNLTPVATIWQNDVQEILNFMNALPIPQTTAQNGDYIGFPASIAPLHS